MKASKFHAYLLAGLITVLAPLSGVSQMGKALVPPVDAARAGTAATTSLDTSKAQAASAAIDASKVSGKIRQQAQEKDAQRERLRQVGSGGGARAGEPIDPKQVSVAEPMASGTLKLGPETAGGFAYVQRYTEPDDYAHRNYCGPGSAVTLLSHWDPSLPGKVDIDQLGRDMNLDPDSGVWVRDIVKPVNDRLNGMARQDLNWYRYGEASNLDEFRMMLDVDVNKTGVPLVTSLQTGRLPGWNGQDIGHIVAVYGYTRDADGKEWVTYADTAPGSSGYEGHTLTTVGLGTFWQAVSENSAQVW